MSTPKITITRWKNEHHSQELILPGTPLETEEEANQYFDPQFPPIGKVDEMEKEEFENLPVFEG